MKLGWKESKIMADFKELITIELNSKTKGYFLN